MSEALMGAGQRNVTIPALVGMAAGFSLGLITRETQAPMLLQLVEVAKPAGTLWTNALRMIVLPLMVSYIVLAINSVPDARTAGKLGTLALISYVAMIAGAALFVLTVGAELVSMLPIDDNTRAAFRAMAGSSDIPAVAPSVSPPGVSGWLVAMVPSNLFRAAVEDNFIGVVISTILFALATMRIAPERRQRLVALFEAVAETTGVLMGWIIYLLPVAAFALSYVIATESGLSVAGGAAYYVAALSALLLAATVILYPVTALIGRVDIRRFISAAAPALAVGAGTRSSMAALPAMLAGAENRLGIRREVAGFILPLSVSTFKLNPAISLPCEIMFFLAVFGIDPSPGLVLSFGALTLLLCLATAGVPSGNKMLTWPLFLSAGVPVEALVLMKVIDAIPDIFKTLLNVTADMSVTVIVQRFAGPKVDAPILSTVVQTE